MSDHDLGRAIREAVPGRVEGLAAQLRRVLGDEGCVDLARALLPSGYVQPFEVPKGWALDCASVPLRSQCTPRPGAAVYHDGEGYTTKSVGPVRGFVHLRAFHNQWCGVGYVQVVFAREPHRWRPVVGVPRG